MDDDTADDLTGQEGSKGGSGGERMAKGDGNGGGGGKKY